jgi:hypothetical protein
MIWPLTARRRLPVDDDAWRTLCTQLPFLHGLDSAQSRRLRELAAEFLSAKTITGAQGQRVDDAMRLTIAAQACLPVLHLGLQHYRDFVEIVVYPAEFVVQRRVTDDDGLVHEFEDTLAGEAMDGGPVVLSWPDAAGGQGDDRTNVVIHEFAHKLDLADGLADGCPPMPAAHRSVWLQTLHAAYDRFVADVEAAEHAIPRHVDPESPAADRFFEGLALDPYAATDEAEFFAVATEVFFVDPVRLAHAFGRLYAELATYFGQDPRARVAGGASLADRGD